DSCAITCWVRSAMRAASSVGSASASSKEFVCRLCVPPSTAASASIAVRTMFTSGCCAVSETPAVCAVLRDLLEEVEVGVEEEAEPGREVVDVEPALDRPLDIGEAVGEREGE